MKRLRLLLFLLAVPGPLLLTAQDYSNKGKEFWIAYPAHIDGTNSVMGLYITAAVATSGTVQVGSGTTINFTVTANQITKLFLGSGTNGVDASNSTVYLNTTDGIITNAAVRISTQQPVVVYSHIIRSARSGATLALPTTVLGAEYIVPSYGSVTRSSPGPGSNGSAGGIGQIVVVATQDNTIVEITPTAAGIGGKPAGTPFRITLVSRGDVYQFQSIELGDLSGSIVKSVSSGSGGCKPIAVFSASTWSTFDCASTSGNPISGGDNLYQQLFPTRSWGKQFVTAPFINRPNDIYRIFVKNTNTVVQVQDNSTVTTLGAAAFNSTGNFYTYKSSNPVVITASDPISVAQYISSQTCKTGCTGSGIPITCYSDPEMVLLNPVEQTLNDITFFSAHRSFVPSGQTAITQHYVNIIVSKNFKNTLKIDNAAPKGTFVDIPGSNYSFLQEDLTTSSATNPIHRVTADSSFSAIVYGYGSFESYGYNGGTNVKDFSPSAIFNNPFNRIDSAVTCLNTPVQFGVPLSFQPTTIRWDFSAAPNIAPAATVGPTTNPVADSSKTVNGQALYYYSPRQTYTFSSTNTASLRDTIKIYTTSATPDGCGSTDQVFTIPVKVTEKPVAKFTITHTGCVTDSVYLADQSTSAGSNINRWEWNFGDGGNAGIYTVPVKAKKYATAADYVIKLRAISDIGCASDETSQTVKMSSKPVAGFTASATRCVNGDIIYTDASSSQVGAIAKWTWNLDNGAGAIVNSTNAPQTTQYSAAGNKNVSLQVETNTGCKSDVFTPGQAIFVNPLPQVGFILPEVCLNDASANFTDTSKIADGSEAQFSYLWNFNAGTPAVTPGPNTSGSTQKNPQVKYNKSDHYNVSLRVTSKDGCVENLTQSFTVNGSVPKADFEVQEASLLCSKTPVVILNRSTVDFGSVTKLEIYWDYLNNPTQVQTDENPAPGKAYPHLYTATAAAGQSFTIRVVAYSGGNTCVSNVSKTITVYPNPKAAFTLSPAEACYNEAVAFTDQSATASPVAPTRWVWDLANGNTTSIRNPAKQFKDSGTFTTSLYVFSEQGCVSDTISKAIAIHPYPVLVMGIKSMTVLEGGVLQLKPSFVYGTNLSYLWTPSTYLNSDTALRPVSTPQNDVTYRLYVTGVGGCSVSDTLLVKVLKSPEIPNVFSPNGDGINDGWRIKYLESYPGATVEVYNRYGQIVFRSTGYSVDWNGTYQGKALPVGTYYYIINPKNGKPVMTGSVTIIK